MGHLPVDLRNQLARAIQEARREGEAGARGALQSLAVHLGKAHDSMDAAARSLRGRLRAHGKQVGDTRDQVKDTQQIDRLAHEVAYEHWHRMLFARFLAENNLLIHPIQRVPISMEECVELASEQGGNPWALAASYAQAMLPKIFRADDPVLDVQLPPETRLALERILQALPSIVFTADDSLGWTYQFWQVEKKEEVNRSGVKIGADELPAVTQLFTEHYMVLFLFHNTIGAWRAGKNLAANPELAKNARDEEELRRAVRLSALGGYDFSYLRFARERIEDDAEDAPSGPWRPAAGTFEGWPKRAAELSVLDPCCGSGHFLVEGLALLVRLRMEEERLSVDEAIRAVLAENLFGLEIDARCTQIAAFNLALAAWKLSGKCTDLSSLNIACSGTAIGSTRDEWVGLLQEGSDPQVRFFFGELHGLFAKGPVLGSLINPRLLAEGRLSAKAMDDLLQSLGAAASSATPERHELGIAAQGLARAAELLADRYTLVITNVPYLGRASQTPDLKKHLEDHYNAGKSDLATAFVIRCLASCGQGGTTALVTPQNWLFLKSYAKLREGLLLTSQWDLVARLGPGAFETISGEVVSVVLLALSAIRPSDDALIAGVDVSASRGQAPIPAAQKASLLRGEGGTRIERVAQVDQLQRPDAVVSFDQAQVGAYLRDYAGCYQGLTTGDDGHLRRCFWEFAAAPSSLWRLLQGPSQGRGLFAGREEVVHSVVVTSNGQLGALRGREAWGKQGIAIDRVGSLARSFYSGDLFHSVLPVVIPHTAADLEAVAAFCLSDEFVSAAGALNPSLSLDNGYVNKLPFDVDRWRDVAAQSFPDGLPDPESSDPTQWLFHGRPEKSEAPLQVAVARFLGYRWPPELDSSMTLSARARDMVQRCDELLGFADHDGIICIPSVRGHKPAADRVLALLSTCGLKPDRDLDAWLRSEFFEEHCKLFHQRPFIWHIWDGRPDGFHALVNYHKLAGPNGEGRRTLEALTYSYLGDWIERQKGDQRDGKEGADGRLAAAQDLQTQLERILSGEPPYDIFVRWKPLHEQPIGWDPDINDGVRINIRPFMSVALRRGGRAGAGILRWKPNIAWKKDRGTEPKSIRPVEEFPWFWRCPGDASIDERTDFKGGAEFDGCRWNDLHYTNEVKQTARMRAAVGRK